MGVLTTEKFTCTSDGNFPVVGQECTSNYIVCVDGAAYPAVGSPLQNSFEQFKPISSLNVQRFVLVRPFLTPLHACVLVSTVRLVVTFKFIQKFYK